MSFNYDVNLAGDTFVIDKTAPASVPTNFVALVVDNGELKTKNDAGTTVNVTTGSEVSTKLVNHQYTSGGASVPEQITLTTPMPVTGECNINVYEEVPGSGGQTDNNWSLDTNDTKFDKENFKGARGDVILSQTATGDATVTLSAGTWTSADIRKCLRVIGDATGMAKIVSLNTSTIANITIIAAFSSTGLHSDWILVNSEFTDNQLTLCNIDVIGGGVSTRSTIGNTTPIDNVFTNTGTVIYLGSPHYKWFGMQRSGSTGGAVESANGKEWSSNQSGNFNFDLMEWAYASGLGGANGTIIGVGGSNYVRSTDGSTLTLQTFPSGTAYERVAWSGTSFLASDISNQIYSYSTDGSTWLTNTSGSATGYGGLAWVSFLSKFVLAGNGVYATVNADGISSFTTGTLTGATSNMNCVSDNGTIVLIGGTDEVFTSSNGTVWARVTLSSLISAPFFKDGLYQITDAKPRSDNTFLATVTSNEGNVQLLFSSNVSSVEKLQAGTLPAGTQNRRISASDDDETFVIGRPKNGTDDNYLFMPYFNTYILDLGTNDIDFIGYSDTLNRLIFVNNAGEVGVSNDGGATWSITSEFPGIFPSECFWEGTNFIINDVVTGNIYRSPTGLTGTWLTSAHGFGNASVKIGVTSTAMVAGASGNTTFRRSTDNGATWSLTSGTTSQNLSSRAIVSNGSTLVCLPTSVTSPYYSTDNGDSWTASSVTLTYNANNYAITYGNGMFVLTVLFTSIAGGEIYTSTDGITWTGYGAAPQSTTNMTTDYHQVFTYSELYNCFFLATNSNPSQLFVSQDAHTWFEHSLNVGTGRIHCIISTNDAIIIGDDKKNVLIGLPRQSISAGNIVIQGTNAGVGLRLAEDDSRLINWNTATSTGTTVQISENGSHFVNASGGTTFTALPNSGSAVNDIIYTGTTYIAGGNNGFLQVSSDLTGAWTDKSINSDGINRFVTNGSRILACATNGNYIYSDDDGVSWTAGGSLGYGGAVRDGLWDGTQFLIITNAGSVVARSTTGNSASWTTVATGGTNEGAIAYDGISTYYTSSYFLAPGSSASKSTNGGVSWSSVSTGSSTTTGVSYNPIDKFFYFISSGSSSDYLYTATSTSPYVGSRATSAFRQVITSSGNRYLSTGNSNGKVETQLSGPVTTTNYVVNEKAITFSNTAGRTSLELWDAINSFTTTENSNGETIFYCYGLEDTSEAISQIWYVSLNGSGTRGIIRNNSGIYEYNSNITYGSETWTSATSNDLATAFNDALAVSANQMTPSQLSAVGTADFASLTDQDFLNFAMILESATDTTTPIIQDVTVNYTSSTRLRLKTHIYDCDVLSPGLVEITPTVGGVTNVTVFVSK